MIEGTMVTGKWLGEEFTGIITYAHDFGEYQSLIIKLNEAIRPIASPPQAQLSVDVDAQGKLVNTNARGFVHITR